MGGIDVSLGRFAQLLTAAADAGQFRYNPVRGGLIARPGSYAKLALHAEPLHSGSLVAGREVRTFRAVICKIQVDPPAFPLTKSVNPHY